MKDNFECILCGVNDHDRTHFFRIRNFRKLKLEHHVIKKTMKVIEICEGCVAEMIFFSLERRDVFEGIEEYQNKFSSDKLYNEPWGEV